jgi:predicted double-glycine peptidase
MKRTILKTLALCCLSFGIASTTLGADGPDKKTDKAAEKAAELNHIAMKDGKLVVMKDGETSEFKEAITLNDGTQVMADGSYTQKNGKKETLKEGEAITWEGKVTDHDKVMKKIEKQKEKAAKEAEKK